MSAARPPTDPRAAFLAVALVFVVGLVLGFVLGRAL